MAAILPIILAAASAEASMQKPTKSSSSYTTVPMTASQLAAQQRLQQQATTPYSRSRLTGQAEDVLSQILGGSYDPFTSPYYTNMRQSILNTQKEQGTLLKQRLQKQGALYGTPTNRAWSDFYSGTNQDILNLLSGVQETERGRQFSAIPVAAQLGTAEQDYNKYLAQLNAMLMGQEQTVVEDEYQPNILSALAPLLAQLAGSAMKSSK